MFSSCFLLGCPITNSQGVFDRTLRDVVDPEINLLVDDGYNNSKSLVRADRFDSAPMQQKQRGMRSVVESAWLRPYLLVCAQIDVKLSRSFKVRCFFLI